jgi:NDP-sugar pyrophosphorylase family protein
MHRKEVRVDLGVLETNEFSQLVSYREKPSYCFNVSMGIYIYEPNVLHYIAKGRYLDFPDLISDLLKDGEKVMGFHSQDYWLDIGRREDYELAQQEYYSGGAMFQGI